MKRSLKTATIVTLVAFVGQENSHGTMLVHDPIATVNYTIHEVLHYVQATMTQINTAKSYVTEVTQLAHMGDVSRVASLVGMSDVGDLINSGKTLYSDYQQLSLLTDPRSFQSDFNSVLSSYRQPTWQGFLAANGQLVSPNQGSYQFATTSYNTSKQTISILEGLQKQRERLEQDLKGLQDRVKSASTHAEILKLNGEIAVVNGEVSDVDNKIHATAERAHLQQVQTDSAEKIYRATQLERQDAADRQGADRELQELPASMFGKTIDW